MSDLTRLVPKPAAASVNTGRSPLHQATVLSIFGAPRSATPRYPDLSEDGPVTNPRLVSKIVTDTVGPFRVTGHRQAVASLRAVLADVKAARPDLYAAVGTAGMLVCRMVRGSNSNWSNHAFGFAVDLTIGGRLDVRGDDRVQEGLLELYPFFKNHGWFWGTEFSTEDSMHFECSDELVKSWQKAGLL